MTKQMILNFGLIFLLISISGCTNQNETLQLREENQRLKNEIQKKELEIAKLNAKKHYKKRTYNSSTRKSPKKSYKKPKRVVVPKEVKDNNFNSSYMYQSTKKATTKKVVKKVSTSVSMSKSECVSMIGKTRYDSYTKMFGNENATLKRCETLKKMSN